MNLKDVKVGESYEYKKWSGGPDGIRAEVLEVGAPLARYDFVGVKVRIHQGQHSFETSIPARALKRPWEDAQEEYKEKREKEYARAVTCNALRKAATPLEVVLYQSGHNFNFKFWPYGRCSVSITIHDVSSLNWLFDKLATEEQKEKWLDG